jgi:ubiquinone/menaquinone biosynthesis C-methylase UbiE
MKTEPRATGKLVNALLGANYVRRAGDRIELAPTSRKWLLTGRPGSVRDKILFAFLEWKWIEHAEEYVRTGQPLDLHSQLTDEEWGLYQRGMRSAGIEAMVHEIARRTKLPAKPQRMLDIGGSHGYYSVAFCRRHPSLSSTILDLPKAIQHAAPLLAREGMGDRVKHRAGDALATELGENEFDFIFIGGLVHHFDDDANRALAKRCARALRPNGVLSVFEALRGDPGRPVGQLAGMMDLTFGMTSRSGCWSADEIASWHRDAGLTPRAPVRIRLMRDFGSQAAVKLS